MGWIARASTLINHIALVIETPVRSQIRNDVYPQSCIRVKAISNEQKHITNKSAPVISKDSERAMSPWLPFKIQAAQTAAAIPMGILI